MQASNSIPVNPLDPVAAAVKIVSASLAAAQARRLHREAVASCAESPRQCRILLDAARREIERLRRGMDRLDSPGPVRFRCVTAEACSATSAIETAPSARVRKPYAVDPLGRPSPTTPDAMPLVAPGIHLHALRRVTNLGSLIDVLA